MGAGGLFLRKLRAKVADEPTGFVWVEEGKVAGSGYPASRAQIEWLVRSGIRSILTLTQDPLPAEWTRGLDLVLEQVAMRDHEAPTVEAMTAGAGFVAKQVRDGRPVAVHCLAGEGRTGCVLAAYLIAYKKMSASDALKSLREVKPEFVEPAQEGAVLSYPSARL